MDKSKKIIIGIVSSIVGLFLLLNIFWISYREIRYKPLTQGFEDVYGIPEKRVDDVEYNVFKPGYLGFGGNLTVHVTSTKYVSKSGKSFDVDKDDGLIIWPSFPSGYEYAACIEIEKSYDPKTKQYVSNSAVIVIDENGEWADTSSNFGKKHKEAFEKKKPFIKELLKDTKEFWNLD